MNIFQKFYYRLFQKIMYVGAFFINFKEPNLIEGKSSIKKVLDVAKKQNYKSIFLVSSYSIKQHGLLDELISNLEENNFPFALYLDVQVNPTIDNVEQGLDKLNKLDKPCIVALGGGSVIDCAKIIAARYTNNKPVNKMKGLFKIRHKLPLLMVAPTTAGTGSETTLAAVILDTKNNDKYAINDPHLIPSYAVLDPNFLLTLPGSITSTTGMDALTHAIEAYLGKSNVSKTKRNALSAIKLIFENLENSYNHPDNLTYRQNMQLASYQAGVAFTRAYVGYVHALAHALGGKYNVAHGYANALILPLVLEAFGKKAHKKLAKIYDYVYGKNNKLNKEAKALHIIEEIKQMNKRMNIVSNFKDVIKKEDIEELVEHAYKESHPLYPVIKFLNKEELYQIYINLSI